MLHRQQPPLVPAAQEGSGAGSTGSIVTLPRLHFRLRSDSLLLFQLQIRLRWRRGILMFFSWLLFSSFLPAGFDTRSQIGHGDTGCLWKACGCGSSSCRWPLSR